MAKVLGFAIPADAGQGDFGLVKEDGQALLIIPLDVATAGSTARVVTPNAEAVFAGAFSTGEGGAPLAVLDITPTSSGLLIVNANFAIQAVEGTDTPLISLYYVDNLVSVNGGTLYAPGLTSAPTSTTPNETSGVGVFGLSQATQVINTQNLCELTFAGVPVQAVAGHRTGLAFFAISP